jgi:hypothetical protein
VVVVSNSQHQDPESAPVTEVRQDPIDALLRQERARRRLPPGAVCAICGEGNPVLLESHHVAGKANLSRETVVLCLNHHREQSANQRAAGIDLNAEGERSMLDRVVAWLRGLALFFARLSTSCREMADRLARVASGLDANYPGWRTMAEANW